jgi:5S rRNA maturation endonuclease (ribonuclease M5)
MNISQIKEQYTCLDYLGKPLRKTSSGWYLYRCPWKEDNHPSLNVSPDGKVWHDQSTGEKGGLIELVMTSLNTKDLSRVCAEFNSFSFWSSKSFNNQKENDIECSVFRSFEVMPLRSRGLYAYLYQRKVNIDIAKRYLQEAHYSFEPRADGNYLYALAYANDKGGYELRSRSYKGCTSPKGITTHLDIENAPVVVFEGFMDMLSWVTLTDGVKHNLVVMNSVVNKEATVELLQSISDKVYLCLDNDKGGDEATAFIKNVLPSVIDYRSHYADCKDVNEYLIKKS